MRRAKVYYKDVVAGILTETGDGEFLFQYHEDYIARYPGQFITFTMPVTNKPYKDNRLFPFCEGLTPEGWCWISPQKTGK